jgi:hypothetical protein
MHQHEHPPADQGMPTTVAVPLNAPLYSRDGQHLGTVKAVRDRCFLVDVRWAFDYWLSRRCVADVCDGQVILAVDKDQVADYLIDSDGLDFDDGPAVDAARRVVPPGTADGAATPPSAPRGGS